MSERDETESRFIWPDVPRVAFGPGFDHTEACVGWALSGRDSAVHGFFEGYARAASALLTHVEERSLSPEYAIWPIAFLWRHHIELGLKRIIASGREAAGGTWESPSGHDLRKLWAAALPFIHKTGDDAAVLANVEANIEQISDLDPTATGFRYLMAPDQKTVALKDPPKSVNLKQLDEAMRAVSAFLDGVHSCFAAELDMRREMERAYR